MRSVPRPYGPSPLAAAARGGRAEPPLRVPSLTSLVLSLTSFVWSSHRFSFSYPPHVTLVSLGRSSLVPLVPLGGWEENESERREPNRRPDDEGKE